MHTPLDPHLHTAKCNEIIKKLIECQQKHGKWRQFLFHDCDDIDYQMRMCTKQERIDRTKQNVDAARVRNEKVKEKLRQQKADGKSWRDALDEK